jgi:hypothetical protein
MSACDPLQPFAEWRLICRTLDLTYEVRDKCEDRGYADGVH